jgi:hypothetical protein
MSIAGNKNHSRLSKPFFIVHKDVLLGLRKCTGGESEWEIERDLGERVEVGHVSTWRSADTGTHDTATIFCS